MSTEPTASAPVGSDAPMDASTAHQSVSEMAALVRVLFGVPVPRQLPTEPDEPSHEPATTAPPQSAAPVPPPVGSIPVPQATPSVPPTQPRVPVPAPPTSLPLPEIPLPDLPAAAADDGVPEPVRETPRRPVGPSLELLQEIAFLDE